MSAEEIGALIDVVQDMLDAHYPEAGITIAGKAYDELAEVLADTIKRWEG